MHVRLNDFANQNALRASSFYYHSFSKVACWSSIIWQIWISGLVLILDSISPPTPFPEFGPKILQQMISITNAVTSTMLRTKVLFLPNLRSIPFMAGPRIYIPAKPPIANAVSPARHTRPFRLNVIFL